MNCPYRSCVVSRLVGNIIKTIPERMSRIRREAEGTMQTPGITFSICICGTSNGFPGRGLESSLFQSDASAHDFLKEWVVGCI